MLERGAPGAARVRQGGVVESVGFAIVALATVARRSLGDGLALALGVAGGSVLVAGIALYVSGFRRYRRAIAEGSYTPPPLRRLGELTGGGLALGLGLLLAGILKAAWFFPFMAYFEGGHGARSGALYDLWRSLEQLMVAPPATAIVMGIGLLPWQDGLGISLALCGLTIMARAAFAVRFARTLGVVSIGSGLAWALLDVLLLGPAMHGVADPVVARSAGNIQAGLLLLGISEVLTGAAIVALSARVVCFHPGEEILEVGGPSEL